MLSSGQQTGPDEPLKDQMFTTTVNVWGLNKFTWRNKFGRKRKLLMDGITV